MLHQLLNQQNQMPPLGNSAMSSNPFAFNNPNEFNNNDHSQLMKRMLLKNQTMNTSNNPSTQNFPQNMIASLSNNNNNLDKKIQSNNFPHLPNNFQQQQPNMFNHPQQPIQNQQQPLTPNQNPNFFNFNSNFPQSLLKNMMTNNKGMMPSNNENKNKLDPNNFTLRKPSNSNNQEMFSSSIDNMSTLPNNENDLLKIKEKTKMDRSQKIEKYKNKKRNWKKKISYDCRKKVADARLRIKGRFISKKVLFSYPKVFFYSSFF